MSFLPNFEGKSEESEGSKKEIERERERKRNTQLGCIFFVRFCCKLGKMPKMARRFAVAWPNAQKLHIPERAQFANQTCSTCTTYLLQSFKAVTVLLTISKKTTLLARKKLHLRFASGWQRGYKPVANKSEAKLCCVH